MALNRVMALAEVQGAEAGLEELGALEAKGLENARPFHVARARLLERTGERAKALAALDEALGLDPASAERIYLENWRRRLGAGG